MAFSAGPARVAECRFTERSDGDFRIDASQPGLDDRRNRVISAPWTWLTQVHGPAVVIVDEPGGQAGVEADAAVTTVARAPLSIQTADCAPVLLIGGGVIGAAHAGWRGLAAGILEATIAAMCERSDGPIRAVVGPHISSVVYEFGRDDLCDLTERFGTEVAATTADGSPALDLAAAVRVVLHGRGVDEIALRGGCTGSSTRWHSHRIRGERERQASVVWLEDER